MPDEHEWAEFLRIEAEVKKLKARMAEIPGEPCGGIYYTCPNKTISRGNAPPNTRYAS